MTKTDEVYAKAALVTNVLVVFGCLSVAVTAAAQPPELSKAQRTILQAVVRAVDAAANLPPTPDSSWPTHVLRASDGSHYVAFSVEPAGDQKLPAGPVLLYVRLATARPPDGATMTAERSPLSEWLAGQRVDPRMLPGRGIAIGEMPAFGPGAIGVRGSTASTGSMDLKLMALERDRARAQEEERAKQRRAELEGRAINVRDVLPFEDFDLAASATTGDGTPVISRALTVGPGSYDLFVAWADVAAAKPAATIQVLRRKLELPPATSSALTLSSVIIADNVQAREVPYPPAQQSAHPYTIGATAITPARDAVFSRDERLAVAFQVINAQPSDTGKPDLGVDFRIVRLDGEREVPVASLTPQSYTAASMPPDFDLRLGHPLFVAMGVPLTTVPRGSYRLKIAVNDRLAGTTRTADAGFRVTGTPLSLLSEAPGLGRAFRREDALEDGVLASIVQGLTPASLSPALRRALDLATGRRFIDLLAEEPVPQHEQATRTALMGLALYAIGDASALVQFQRAYALGAPGGPVQFLSGAVRATQNRDPDAIAAWQSAKDEGFPMVSSFLVNAYLRRSDGARASALVASELAGRPATGVWVRSLAATHLAMGRYQDALAVLDAQLAGTTGEDDSRWLQLQALYGLIVKNGSSDRARFRTAAQAYVAAGEANAALAAEWLRAVP